MQLNIPNPNFYVCNNTYTCNNQLLVQHTFSNPPRVLPSAYAAPLLLDDRVGAHHGEGHAGPERPRALRALALLARALREVVDLYFVLSYFF